MRVLTQLLAARRDGNRTYLLELVLVRSMRKCLRSMFDMSPTMAPPSPSGRSRARKFLHCAESSVMLSTCRLSRARTIGAVARDHRVACGYAEMPIEPSESGGSAKRNHLCSGVGVAGTAVARVGGAA